MFVKKLTATFLVGLFFLLATSTVHASVHLRVDLFGTSDSSDNPFDIVFAEEVVDNGLEFSVYRGRASVESLGVEINARSIFGARTVGIGSSFAAEVMFVSDPSITTAEIFWTADIRGTISGQTTSFVGGGYEANLKIGSLSESVSGDGFLSPGSPPIEVDREITLSAVVPTNVALNLEATFSIRNIGGPRGRDRVRVDFLDSMSFNPDRFFDIKTPNVTANSVDSSWLVNNRIMDNPSVPEPCTVAIWSGLGLIGLAGGWHGRRQRLKRRVARLDWKCV